MKTIDTAGRDPTRDGASAVDHRRPELHASGFRAIIEIAERELGKHELDGLLASLGVTAAELGDANAWFSLEFAERLMTLLVERAPDSRILDQAIRLAVSPRHLGIVYPLFRSFGTPAFMYRQLARLIPRLNKVTTWEVDLIGPQSVRVSVRRRDGAPREQTPHFCHVRSVQLAEGATLFSLPPAEVEHKTCMFRGDPACVYDVRWKEHRRPLWSWIGPAAGPFVFAIASAGSDPALPLAGGLAVISSIGGWAVGRTYELRETLRARLDDLESVYQALANSTRAHEERFAELLEAKAEVDSKVELRTSELREVTTRLSAALNELQALDRAKTDFFNNVSHELRSPLTLILAPLQDLAAGITPPGDERSVFESMHRNAARLLQLINQLLDLAKIDAGQMKLALSPTDLLALIQSILEGFKVAAQKKGVLLEFQAPASMLPVTLDPTWIESAFANLVSNALRLTPSGGAIRVAVEEHDQNVSVAVIDSGPGIALEDQAKVFERFAQGDHKQAVGGTGIGLALVREAVRLHGGDVSLVSELGKGATFTLVLPRRSDDLHVAPVRPNPQLRSDQINVLASSISDAPAAHEHTASMPNAPLALVVEDNAELRDYIMGVLSVRYRVHATENGAIGLAAAIHLKPDVVVSDVAMPEMDGYRLCQALRANTNTAEIPVVLVTARTDVAQVLRGFEAGANDYVLKPFHGRELLARVDVHVRFRRMQQQLALSERQAGLGMLAASVAHQVRNPLTTLVSGLPAMQSRIRSKIDPNSNELIDLMIDCADRIDRLTGDLLRLSRTDRETTEMFRPSDGLQVAVRLVRTRLPSNVTIDEAIEESPVIETRPGDVNQAVLNVLDNAVRAVGDKGLIRVESSVSDQWYTVRVGDSGKGVDDETAGRIFEPFFTTRPAGEGTGLGLSIARQVMQQAGGTIEVGRSSLGGAEFTLRIPL